MMFGQTNYGAYQQPVYGQAAARMPQPYQPTGGMASPQPMPATMPTPMQNQIMQSDIIWVPGVTAANDWIVQAGQTVTLWDSGAPIIYIKSRDIAGNPMMRILDYTERPQAQPGAPMAARPESAEYVTRKDFEELAAIVAAMKEKQPKKQVKEDTSNG